MVKVRKCFLLFIAVLVIPIIIFCAISVKAEGSESDVTDGGSMVKGKVINIISSNNTDANKNIMEKQQKLKIEITEGKHDGEKIDVTHTIQPSKPDNIEFKTGDELFLSISEDNNGKINEASVYQVVRQNQLLHLLIFFAASIILIGGIKGFKSLITLTITCLIIIKVFLPLILQGYNPIIVSTIICIVITIISLIIVSGFNKKTTAAILGTSSGVIIAGVIAYIYINLTSVSGVGTEDAQLLMDSLLKGTLNFKGILFGSILIGTLGAVMDVSMSIASTMNELKENNPRISNGNIIKAGMSVGRDTIGTMTTTLILAYISGTVFLVLGYMVSKSSFIDIINQDMIASDIIKTFASSIGLIFTIPITVFAYWILDNR
ncbi:YibE/F family protein [Clostridium luticellarii]|uniref:YibE/F-like protein n=1 Tax=Clostridium luticellarii TaxID=1691940 RepID=A0A2T0BMC5_9CLOT|nr:YibE/F family protein [Clostridium luticellarii]MCI1945004.1 YibE/F family protein [Clostridium luticellarii]MCI1967846.1 YibE/F family protein [Clostridium luticellarii]MCI1995784.1 YibE/F family protein [Clostridium luticellarii]MCI2040923.1 YibE/F family protein [Clostridium luticellarii]PRR85036.1 YibE/F-like protein [Clostridium luticellarii]